MDFSWKDGKLLRDKFTLTIFYNPETTYEQFTYYNKVTDMLTRSTFDDFLTSVCYPHIMTTADPTVSTVFLNRSSKL